MVWTRMWEHLSSWLLSKLIWITTVIHLDQTEKWSFALESYALFHSANYLFLLPQPLFQSPSVVWSHFSSLLVYYPVCIFLPLLFSSSSIYFHTEFLLSSISVEPPSLFLLILPLPQAVVDGSETSVVLDHLSSLTEYQLAVFAVYANEASEALRGSETTRTLISKIKI